jgi:protein-S-isoprenylcysteine O-methyltransferase Ste14
MRIKIVSLLGLVIAVLGLVYLIRKDHILSENPVSIIIQIASIALMIWARFTFGLRSFHATANTTKGKLVTTGPYHFLRHPIYASIIYFTWASVISYPFLDTVAAVILISGGLFVRMILEEKSLKLTYDNYAEYSKHAKRIIPYLF